MIDHMTGASSGGVVFTIAPLAEIERSCTNKITDRQTVDTDRQTDRHNYLLATCSSTATPLGKQNQTPIHRLSRSYSSPAAHCGIEFKQ